jgi:hypothetical protein
LPEWIYEAGIGEQRAALVADGAIVAARIVRDGDGLRPGLVAPARLVEIVRKGALGLVRFDDGQEAMLRPLPPRLTQGATANVRIVRDAVPERGRPKRALAVPSDDPPAPPPTLAEELAVSGHPVRILRAHQPDALEAAGWSELLEEAASGEIAFPGGALRMTPTPAMTLFDVDGEGDPGALALAGARAAAAAILRHDIGGSIGLDLPTVANKGARQAVDRLLADLLPDAERTAMNGFGFVQLVRRRQRVSLPELVQADPPLAEALALLRRLERDPQPVAVAPAAVLTRIGAGWRADIARRTGRAIEWRSA